MFRMGSLYRTENAMGPIERDIIRLASAVPDEETCGFVLNDGMVVATTNQAANPREEFEIGPVAFAHYEGRIGAIWHSHPGGEPIFSPADVRSCKALGIPWILYHVPTGIFRTADPTGNTPYVGRDWVYGLNDCFGLVTDWLRKEIGFDFPDVDRYDDKPEPSYQILENFPPLMRASGLVEVDGPPRYGDVLFMRINGPLPNHCAVMVNPQTNRILHHLKDRLSETDFYGSYWRKVTESIWRVA